MTRIAVLVGPFHSGGKKNLVMEYYRHIDRSKIQFDFICDEDSNAIPKEEIEALGGRVFLVPSFKKVTSHMKALRAIFRENNYPIVHGYNSTMNVFGMKAAKDCHIPIRINESISMGHKGEGKSLVKNLLRPFSKCYATHLMANGVTCGIWQFGETAYQAGKIQVFKTAINTSKQHFDAALREETRKKFQIEDNLVIGHIGRLTPQKNTLFLIDIFSEIYKLEPKAKLLLIGDGDLRKPMEEKIQSYGLQDVVLDLGRREDIYQFYNAMDCFVLPSLYEGLPVVGVESQCVGLPVFFSTEIPEESSACDDLGIFIGLEQSAVQWAEQILAKTKTLILTRRDHSEEVKAAGFDSTEEAKKLERFYLQELDKQKVN